MFEQYHHLIYETFNNPNANYDPQYWWDQEAELFASDIEKGIEFIQNECSDEELYWLSEVFIDIIEKSQSLELLAALQKRSEKVSDAEKKNDIDNEIQYSRSLIHRQN